MKTKYVELYEKVYAGMNEFGKENQEVMKGFMAIHKACASNGALDAKTKELLSVAISIAVHCEGCIACHVNDALKAGASHNEIIEVIGVAVLMGGGPALVYGTKALEALKEFEAK